MSAIGKDEMNLGKHGDGKKPDAKAGDAPKGGTSAGGGKHEKPAKGK